MWKPGSPERRGATAKQPPGGLSPSPRVPVPLPAPPPAAEGAGPCPRGLLSWEGSPLLWDARGPGGTWGRGCRQLPALVSTHTCTLSHTCVWARSPAHSHPHSHTLTPRHAGPCAHTHTHTLTCLTGTQTPTVAPGPRSPAKWHLHIWSPCLRPQAQAQPTRGPPGLPRQVPRTPAKPHLTPGPAPCPCAS